MMSGEACVRFIALPIKFLGTRTAPSTDEKRLETIGLNCRFDEAAWGSQVR
jgi:hypothetical protein